MTPTWRPCDGFGHIPALPGPRKATASAPTLCGRSYGRDVVPLSPAVREANRRD
jgi:hypothetical protein